MPRGIYRYFLIAVSAFMVWACAATSNTQRTHFDENFANASFGRFLVIGVAGSYNNRAQFERTLASRLRSIGAAASAYYTVVPGNEPISRESVFDAVIVTRVLGQQSEVAMSEGSSTASASAIGGRPINLFRYDYEELNEPGNIDINMNVTLSTELFSAADEKMIWAIEFSDSSAENIGEIIDSAVDTIVTSLSRDRLIR